MGGFAGMMRFVSVGWGFRYLCYLFPFFSEFEWDTDEHRLDGFARILLFSYEGVFLRVDHYFFHHASGSHFEDVGNSFCYIMWFNITERVIGRAEVFIVEK